MGQIYDRFLEIRKRHEDTTKEQQKFWDSMFLYDLILFTLNKHSDIDRVATYFYLMENGTDPCSNLRISAN